MAETLLAIDQGTTSSRAILFTKNGDIAAIEQRELPLITPHSGWVEQDPEQIWRDTKSCIENIRQQHMGSIAAIGITNQRETTVIWNKKTGKPVYNAIVWQDRRTAAYCETLKQKGLEKTIAAKTGLLLDPYFSAAKIAWILDNVSGARRLAQEGDLAFGTIDSFLLWHLTEGQVHATDITNASRTMLLNIHTGQWDDELLEIFNIPHSLLPEVRPNIYEYGDYQGVPIRGMAGDQQAALIGQACFGKGMVKSTYGTGCFALINIGTEFKPSKNRLLTTIAYQLDGKITYAIEGSIFMAGAAVQWLRDDMKFFAHASDSEALAQSIKSNDGVYVVPAFTGLGAPYWNPEARGLICGLARGMGAAHITRAVLEAQAYQTKDLMAAMQADSGVEITTLRVDGGLVANRFVCQFLADMLNVEIDVPRITETTALGAAALAAMGAGLYKSLTEVAANWQLASRYTPRMEPAERAALYAGWQHAVKKVQA